MNAAVITPWFNHSELWDDYREALELGPRPRETWIVDNGSDPALMFASLRNRDNLGFCRACNQGLRAAQAEVVVFLNNDVTATEAGWLQELVDAVEPGILAGPRLRFDPHTVVDYRVIPYLDGWCLAGLREDLLDLGGFDETLVEPAYYSDNLLCLEARAHGMTLREVPVGVRHKLNVTAQDRRDVRAATEANQVRYQKRARELLLTTSKEA